MLASAIKAAGNPESKRTPTLKLAVHHSRQALIEAEEYERELYAEAQEEARAEAASDNQIDLSEVVTFRNEQDYPIIVTVNDRDRVRLEPGQHIDLPNGAAYSWAAEEMPQETGVDG